MTTLTVAGGKGGCGRTTTTLGLTTAAADRGHDALALDAVPGVPDLHRAAGVPAEPTVASLADGAAVDAVSHRVPNGSGARIVPGSPDRRADRRRAIEFARYGGDPLVIDSPGGATPDATRPVALADGIVLVTTPTAAGERAAHKTATIARALDAPVRATVVVGAEEPPDWADRPAPGRPILAVPRSDRRDAPLRDERVMSTYRRLCAVLDRE